MRERVYELARDRGYAVVRREGRLTRQGVTALVGPGSQGDTPVVRVWAMYGVDGPIDRKALPSLHLDIRERIDGLITVSEVIPFRNPKAFQDDLDALWSRLWRLQHAVFEQARWQTVTRRADRPLNLNKTVYRVEHDDLLVLLRAWGWVGHSGSPRANMAADRAEIDGQRFSCRAPEFGEDAGDWNGIAMIGYLDEVQPPLLEAWCVDKDLKTDWSGFGRHRIRSFSDTRVEVAAFLDVSQGVTIRTIHDRLERFARILGRLRKEAEGQRNPPGDFV